MYDRTLTIFFSSFVFMFLLNALLLYNCPTPAPQKFSTMYMLCTYIYTAHLRTGCAYVCAPQNDKRVFMLCASINLTYGSWYRVPGMIIMYNLSNTEVSKTKTNKHTGKYIPEYIVSLNVSCLGRLSEGRQRRYTYR